MSTDLDPMHVDCGVHGKRVAAILCRHLVKPQGEPAGFIENSSHPNDLQAWCFQCEAVFESEDGLTPKFKEFNQMSVVCVTCYEHSASYHSTD